MTSTYASLSCCLPEHHHVSPSSQKGEMKWSETEICNAKRDGTAVFPVAFRGFTNTKFPIHFVPPLRGR